MPSVPARQPPAKALAFFDTRPKTVVAQQDRRRNDSWMLLRLLAGTFGRADLSPTKSMADNTIRCRPQAHRAGNAGIQRDSPVSG
jgi:hypothetical protein